MKYGGSCTKSKLHTVEGPCLESKLSPAFGTYFQEVSMCVEAGQSEICPDNLPEKYQRILEKHCQSRVNISVCKVSNKGNINFFCTGRCIENTIHSTTLQNQMAWLCKKGPHTSIFIDFSALWLTATIFFYM